MTTLELREKRAKAWEAAKAFLDSRRNDKGILSAEDDATYTKMEQEITDLGKEIARQERREALEAELNRPTATPLTGKPLGGSVDERTGRATDEYRSNFWNLMRTKNPMPQVVDALRIGSDSEGGYLVPDEYERTLVEALEEENIFRSLAHIIRTASGERKIPVMSSKGTASWIEEGGAFPESNDTFGQVTIGAYKLGTTIKISEELLNDSVFDLPSYIAREFARRIGTKEEEAFFTGDGSGKPLGVLADTGGAEVGVTAASATAITADELLDLYYSLFSPYRKKAVWVVNDSTIKAIRKLKDNNGQYLWQPGLIANAPDTILGRPVKTSAFMPSITAGAKSIIFGDFNYYWIADRQGRTFKRLNELYATTGGALEVNESEAEVIRRIYSEFLDGLNYEQISEGLNADGIPTRRGSDVWFNRTVMNVLTNEKYKGDCLFQKTFNIDPIAHKAVPNKGQLPQYYLEDCIPPIVSKEVWTLAQLEIQRRQTWKPMSSVELPFKNRIVCGTCGSGVVRYYAKRKGGALETMWRCGSWRNGKSKGESLPSCAQMKIPLDAPEKAFVRAWNLVVSKKLQYGAALRRRAENAEDALTRYRAEEMLRLLDEVGKLPTFDYYFSLKVLDHMELIPDGKLAVVFLSGVWLTL